MDQPPNIDPGLDSYLLFVITLFLILSQAYSLRWGWSVMRVLPRSHPGGELLRILMAMTVAGLLAQSLFFFSAVLRLADPIGTLTERANILLIVELIFASATIWAMWATRAMSESPTDMTVEDHMDESFIPPPL